MAERFVTAAAGTAVFAFLEMVRTLAVAARTTNTSRQGQSRPHHSANSGGDDFAGSAKSWNFCKAVQARRGHYGVHHAGCPLNRWSQYGMTGVHIVHAGRTDPVGEIILAVKNRKLNLPAGTAMLLRVIGKPALLPSVR